jgi:hypothetical protein
MLTFIKKIIQRTHVQHIIYMVLGTILFLVPVFFAPTLLTPFLETKTFLFLFLVEVAVLFYVWLIIIDRTYLPHRN